MKDRPEGNSGWYGPRCNSKSHLDDRADEVLVAT
jgi:hypothetical protein